MSQIVDIIVDPNIIEVEVTTLGEQGIQGEQGEQGFNGWQQETEIEIVQVSGVDKAVKKLVGYFGGTGEEPTENVGKYEGVGGWVDTPAEAFDYINEVSEQALSLKADKADIKSNIDIVFTDLTTSTTYTNLLLKDKVDVPFQYKNPTTVDNGFLTFNSSGVTTLPVTAVAGFVGTIFGTTGVLSSYIKTDYLLESINLYDKSKNVNGFYISASTGALISNATSAVSDIIPVTGSELYTIAGRTFIGGMVFYNSIGTKLKPQNENGVEYTFYDLLPYNGVVKAPATAVSVQIGVKFVGSDNSDTTFFYKGTEKRPYVAFESKFIKKSFIPTSYPNTTFEIEKFTGGLTVRGYFDETYDIVTGYRTTDYNNGIFNPYIAKLVLKTDLSSVSGKQLNGANPDDSGPSIINGIYLGGNHGRYVNSLTATGHGKTLADVGAIYKDTLNNEFVLLKVVNANTLLVSGRTSTTADDWRTFKLTVGNLTYVSGGVSTTLITVTANQTTQLYPSIKNLAQQVLLDGINITTNGVYYGNELKITEKYDIVDTADMVAKIISARPVGGYLTQPDFTNADAMVSIKNVYDVQKKNKSAVISEFKVVKQVNLFDFGYYGIVQAGFVTPSWTTSIRRYHPNLLPFTNNSVNYDFRLKPDIKTSVFTGLTYFNSSLWQDGKATSRVVDMLESGDYNVNFNLGYLPLGGVRSSMVNNAWLLANGKKLYPQFIDGKIGTLNIVPAGTTKQGVAFRGWSKPSGLRSNGFTINNGGLTYVYLDYHAIGTDYYSLDVALAGKKVTVIDKSSNITINTDIIVDGISVEISTSTPMYGYCELLIS